ncbi:hypothetical protein SADUNF_Sadunf06G0148100 [Salix dunnii]|uniref:Uncharacterized protein n=1 Tax=Salix dunnii TaxID=1413687 RepID=A0A835N337_9ROSI|nr:hypothetical protein SADUNF_Sadunf06G0148100 [Salix dunnii]
MASGAAEMILKCIFSGSISLSDMEIRRRPYHRNCKCALHNLKDICSDACPQQRSISFPKKQVRSDHSLSIAASRLSSPSSRADDSSMRNIGSLFLEGASDTTIIDNSN